MKELKYKGEKCYGVARSKEGGKQIICTNIDLETVKRSLDSNFDILVEMTVTRVFTRERDLKEIEIENL